MDTKVITGLSGDDTAFKTVGKLTSRKYWHSYAERKFREDNRALNFLWLANNQLTDVDPILDKANSVFIPDNNNMNKAAKRKTLKYHYGMAKSNKYIHVASRFTDFLNVYGYKHKFDFVNFDSCNHLDWNTIWDMKVALQFLSDQSYFFATIAQASQRSKMGDKFPEYKRISGDLEGIKWQIELEFSRHLFNSKSLPEFPFTYETGTVRTRHMYSFGWELTRT